MGVLITVLVFAAETQRFDTFDQAALGPFDPELRDATGVLHAVPPTRNV